MSFSNLFKKKKNTPIIHIQFTGNSQTVEVSCNVPKLVDALKDKQEVICDEITTLRRLVPGKLQDYTIFIDVWVSEGKVQTTLNYTFLLRKYLRAPGDVVVSRLNEVFKDMIRMVVANGVIYG